MGVPRQPMLEGVEVLVGAIRDPVLGPFVVVAPGASTPSCTGAPCARPRRQRRRRDDRELPASARLGSYRGSPPADRPALVDAVVRVAGPAALNRARRGT
jgi:hypothetical protein